ncbi:MAG: FecR domain-containing protein [Pseudomonadota bacterium]
MTAPTVAAQELCARGALVVATSGDVGVAAADGSVRPLALSSIVCPGERVITGADGRVELRLPHAETVLGLDANAELFLPGTDGVGETEDGVVRVGLSAGVLRFLSSVRQVLQIDTRHATAGIDGTEAIVALAEIGTLIVVREGDVAVDPLVGEDAGKSIVAGQSALVRAGEGQVEVLSAAAAEGLPPRLARLAVDPAGASDWAIHYPPLVPDSADRVPAIAAAVEALSNGAPDAAEARLAELDDTLTDRQAADADALRAIIALLRGRADEGAERAEAAVGRDPGSAAAKIALSYALQGQGRLREARQAAIDAAALAPADPFIAARVAEVSLLIGDRRRARNEAEAALALGPTSLAGAVEGFALLQADRRTAAIAAFETAIAADSTDPLPRLGLGLAFIRAGDLVEGRREIETATALSPRQAALRTWLGRAYAAEDLDDKALAQYDLARDDDPDDPVPLLLQGETLFRANRPVEALSAVRQAEALGGRRSTLRGVQGLAEDRATRGAALGRVLEVTGFEDAAVEASAVAIETDPSNAAAQGVFSDLIRKRERQEIPSLSAALANQVWRRPSTERLDPARQEADLALIDAGAAARPTLAEFGPYFDSDGVGATVSGELGTQETRGGTVAGAGMAHGWSAAASLAHRQTDGFAENNDIFHTLLGAEIRGQILPDVVVFGAFGYRASHTSHVLVAPELLSVKMHPCQ